MSCSDSNFHERGLAGVSMLEVVMGIALASVTSAKEEKGCHVLRQDPRSKNTSQFLMYS
jgi:hypothetical protein